MSGSMRTVLGKPKIQVIVGSVREGRLSLPVAQWVCATARAHGGLDIELVDLADWPLPVFALATAPAMGGYTDPLQQLWAAKIGQADGYIMVSPEYNHGTSAVLKNALDYLYAEWNRKPVGFVAHGNAGGARAVEQLRAAVIELRMAPLGEAVHLFGVRERVRADRFDAGAKERHLLEELLDSLIWWSEALTAARSAASATPRDSRSARSSGG